MKTIKVLLADDHAIVVEGLCQVIKDYEGVEVVGEVANGEEVLRFLRFDHADVVVMDINMPVMDGLTCSKQLKEISPETKIVILTMYPQRSFIDEIIKIGVEGCLLKNNTGKELEEAIRRVAGGKMYYDQIKTFNSKEDSFTQYKISKRELEIIKCAAGGLTSSEIAEKLFISVHTVQTHRKNILKKLHLKNSAELVQYAMQQQIV
jgi:DNA-binding NarL/FixJ family response regulator